MITTPAEALDRIGITLGQSVVSRAAPSAVLRCAPGVNPSTMYFGQPTAEMLDYDQRLPAGSRAIPAPRRHQDLRTPTTDTERARWSAEAEIEAQRRGWVTSRRPTRDGQPDLFNFDCWRPLEDEA